MKIYATKIHGRKTWVADLGQVNGKRKRRFFQTKELAKAEIESVQFQRKTAGDVWLGLTAAERVEAATIIKEVKERGLTLRNVWDGFLRSDQVKIAEVVTVKDAVEKFVASRNREKYRKDYKNNLRTLMNSFVEGRDFQNVHKVTKSDIESFIRSKGQEWAQNTAYKRLATFFKFCLENQWVAANPMKDVERVDPPRKRPVILTVRQAARAVVATRRKNPEGLAAVSLALFSGVRTTELQKITWDDVRLDDGVVTIDYATAKTGERRIVHLQPAALAWLKVAKDVGATLPMTQQKWFESLQTCSKAIGKKRWPMNVFRHSAASYMIAELRDAPEVSMELGNSVPVLHKHYREIVTRRDAARFWRLIPRKFRAGASPAGSSCSPLSNSRN